MPKPERPWQVTPHKPIEKLDDNLWTVRGHIPDRPEGGDRRMAIVKLSDGRLAFYNAVPLDDAALAEVQAWGRPSLLILPYNLHMMDGHAFAERLGLKIYGPKNDAKMAARVKLEGSFEEFPKDPAIGLEPAAGMKSGEPILTVNSAGGQSLMFADSFMNVPAGPAPLFARIAGIPGGPRIPRLIKFAFVKDKKALRAQLERLASLPHLTRLIPSHGEIVSKDAAG